VKMLITGSNGMLGEALTSECASRGHDVIGLDLSDADVLVDLTDDAALSAAFNEVRPDVVINCAAIVDVALCDSDPLSAWKLNARAVGVLAEQCRRYNAQLVQVSTDHYFSGDGPELHDEKAPVSFLNEYARTKFAGEGFALSGERSLVLRTNIIGFRGHGKPTFAEWAFDAVENDRTMTLFEDSFVSCIDTASFSEALLDLTEKNAHGLFNVANHEVFSKQALIEEIAQVCGKLLTRASVGSVKQLGVRRADSCGLDVSRAEEVLGYRLPSLGKAVMRLGKRRRSENAG
jgi:dTDP-4-dehydrorhamnose reductase